MSLLSAAGLFLYLLIAFAIFYVGIRYIYDVFFDIPPFISTPERLNTAIIESLSLQNDNVLYDLGCGRGKVLYFLAQKYPHTTMIGIEKRFLPFWIAKWRTRNMPNVSIYRKDLFDTEVSEATHLYMYLLPSTLNALLPKIRSEMSAGSTIVTCDFEFSNLPCSRRITMPETHIIGRALNIYTL